jgi:cell division protein FtsB
MSIFYIIQQSFDAICNDIETARTYFNEAVYAYRLLSRQFEKLKTKEETLLEKNRSLKKEIEMLKEYEYMLFQENRSLQQEICDLKGGEWLLSEENRELRRENENMTATILSTIERDVLHMKKQVRKINQIKKIEDLED